MNMSFRPKRNAWTFVFILALMLTVTYSFTFKDALVTSNSYITSVTTTYTVALVRIEDNDYIQTTWETNQLNTTSTVILAFPNQYSLTNSITCLIQMNSTGPIVSAAYTLLANQITLSGLFAAGSNLQSIIIIVNNVQNPITAGQTGHFYGYIGDDVSSGFLDNSAPKILAASSICSFTFNPNIVYSSGQAMVYTLTTKNSFPSTGTITLTFPVSLMWSGELNPSRLMSISSATCSNRSTNVGSIQCTATSTNVLTLTNISPVDVAAGTTLSFAIDSFISPPTGQGLDVIVINMLIGGAVSEKCNAYVTGLVAKPIASTNFVIRDKFSNPMIVNKIYITRFQIKMPDFFSTSDSYVITFPAGITVSSFNTSGLTQSFPVLSPSASTYSNGVLTGVFSTSGVVLNPSTVLFVNVYNLIAPSSTHPTDYFTFTLKNSAGYQKAVSSQTLTANSGTMTGTVTMTTTSTVNAISSYAFAFTISDGLSSSGRIKVVFPTILTLTDTSSTCASLTGSLMSTNPICTYVPGDHSIMISSINSSNSNIPGQTFTLTVNGIQNPPSLKQTSNFLIATFYLSSDPSTVDTGSIAGIMATTATIDKFIISSSSLITSATGVTYYFTFTVANPISAGGYIILNYPLSIKFDIASSVSCEVKINNDPVQPTSCTAVAGTNYVFNYTNPFIATATIGTNITLSVVGAATNPPTTQNVNPFSIYTYYSDGTNIANLIASQFYKMTIPSTLIQNQISKVSNKNAEFTTFSLSISQIAALEANAVIRVTFPSNLVPQSNSTCSMTYSGTTTTVSCSLNANVFKIISISSIINAGVSFTLSFTNIKNALSFSPITGFTVTTKSFNDLYTYSSSSSTNSVSNSIPSPFTSIIYQYSPQQLNTPIVLQISFELSQYTLTPGYLMITIDSYFIVSSLFCSAFIDFTGVCTPISNNTIKVTGTFNSSIMGLTISGFSSQNTPPSTVTYTVINTFDSLGFKIDQNANSIIFSVACNLPCKTCVSSNKSQCLSCYSSTLVANQIYYYTPTLKCYVICPDTTYNNNSTMICTACDSNCYTCLGTPTYCTKCIANSTYPYLNITNITKTCVSACIAGMYPQTSIDPVTCIVCKTPCATCTSQTSCITCLSGFFLLGNNTCTLGCPANTTVANNLTNTCDVCSSICLTCIGSTSTCTACNSPLVFYNGSCQTSCPSGGTLAPYLGICTACISICQTCSLSISNCTSCYLSSANIFLVNNTCLVNCPQYYYNQSTTGSCISCVSANINCINCLSSLTCSTCDNSFVLFNNTCLPYVPTGYVNISGIAVPCSGDCETCSIAAANCTSCKTLNLEGNACILNCGIDKISINKICTGCTNPCKTCSINLYNCTSCLTTLTPPLFLSGYTCQAICPNFTYANTSNYQCTPCVNPCLICSTATICIECVTGTSLYNSSCLPICPSGFTGINKICQICTNNCKTCSGATNNCLTCINGTYFSNTSNSCLTTCTPSMFIDYATQSCISCTDPCKTCINSTTTCTSCLTGSLYLSNCIPTCPAAMFSQLNTCANCPNNCSVCTSLSNCSLCLGNTYLYNNYCVATCPTTKAVVLNGQCMSCSTQNCYACTSTDVCNTCNSGFLFLKGLCLTNCPSGYNSNGTHCIDVLSSSLTSTPNTFPVPFSIAAAVLVVACLMSRLQFNETFLSGAIYSFLSLLEWGALWLFLYLYYIAYMSQPTPLLIALGSMGFLYLLNIAAIISQSIFLCNEKQFQNWLDFSCFNRFFYGLSSVISLLVNHKFRNILFCKLFTFKIFSAKLNKVQNFKVFNIFSFVSLIHSGGAIFAACIAITKINTQQQIYYACVDVIIITSINVLMAFFNTSKDKQFFSEYTPQGFTLHKKNLLDEEHLGDKINGQNDGENQEGFISTYAHALTSKQALKFQQSSDHDNDIEIYSDNSLVSIAQKQYEQISVQALDLIDEKANITAKTASINAVNVSNYKPQYQQISIQADEMLDNTKQKAVDFSDLPDQGMNQDISNFTNYFQRVDQSVQGNLDRGINQSVQMQNNLVDQSAQNTIAINDQADKSIQKFDQGDGVDCSVQKFNVGNNDVSIQKNASFSRADISVQRTNNNHEVSVQPSFRQQDQSVSMTNRAPKSYGVQQKATLSDKNMSMQASMRDQSNQLTIISQHDEEIQMQNEVNQQGIQPTIDEYQDYGIQPSIQYNQIAVQPTLSVQNQIQQIPEYNQIAIQYQPDDQVDYNEFEDELHNSNTHSNVIFEQQYHHEDLGERKLVQEKVEHLEMQPENIRTYQEELQERIRNKEKELQEIKRKIDVKEKLNQRKKEEIANKRNIQEDQIQLEGVQYVEQRPVINVPTIKSKPSQKVQNIQVGKLGRRQSSMRSGRRQNDIIIYDNQPAIKNSRELSNHPRDETIQQIKIVQDQPADISQRQKTISQINVYRQQPMPEKAVSKKPQKRTIDYKQVNDDLPSQGEQYVEVTARNQPIKKQGDATTRNGVGKSQTEEIVTPKRGQKKVGEIKKQASNREKDRQIKIEQQPSPIIKKAPSKKETESDKYVKNEAQSQHNSKQHQKPIDLMNQFEDDHNGFIRSNQIQALSEIQLKSQGNRQSEATKKNYQPRKNIIIDVTQMDKSLDGDEDYIEIEQASESDREPRGIISNFQHNKPKFRDQSPSDDMSGTIQEIPKHYSKADHDRTLNDGQYEIAKGKQPVTSRIDRNAITSYYSGNIGSNLNQKAKGREMPAQQDSTQKFHINKLYANNMPTGKQANQDSFPRNVHQREQKSNTLAMAGKAQFTEDLIKKKKNQNNPLNVNKNWQAQHEDKYISDEDFKNNQPNRANLVKKTAGSNLQNFASHLVLPQQTDHQDTSFKHSIEKKQEKAPKNSKVRQFSANVNSKRDVEEIQVHFEAEQFSQDLSAKSKNQSPSIPRAYQKRMESNAGQSDIYDQQSEDIDYKRMMILGQMQQRPNNDDLQDYYQRKKGSKQKGRRSNSKTNRSTQKIYMQRMDKGRK